MTIFGKKLSNFGTALSNGVKSGQQKDKESRTEGVNPLVRLFFDEKEAPTLDNNPKSDIIAN